MVPSEPGLRWRPRAMEDVRTAAWAYRDTAGSDVATRFVGEIRGATSQITDAPEAGSLRIGVELGIPNLRARALTPFPYLVFYFVHAETVEVVCVLHARRDVGARIQE